MVNADINNIYDFSFMYMYALFYFIIFYEKNVCKSINMCMCVY